MNWQGFLSDDRQEQEQLDICRALIEDATKDTTLWLQADPSAEERVHILAIQAGLTDLARIVERRMERRKEAKDEWEYSETVAEVLSGLDKAREVRGNIVGKGLARLADRLPKELPSTKSQKRPRVTAPPPIEPVNTSGGLRLPPAPPASVGGLGIVPYQSKPTEVPHDPPTYFPFDLWPRTNVILLEAQRKFPHQTQALELCKHVTSEMTPLFCEAVKAGKLKAGAVLTEGLGGMEDLLHFLLVCNDDGPKSGFSSLSDQAYRLGEKVRQSDEWLTLAKAIADAQIAPQPSPSTAGGKPADRRAMVDAYIAEILTKTGGRISRKDIWLVAGYDSATEFERFQRNDQRTTQIATTNFNRVLGMKPDDFIRALERRKATKNAQPKRAE